MINPPLSELTYEIGGMPVVVEGGVSMPSLERMDSMAPFRIEAEVQDVLLHWQLDAGVSAPLVPASFDMPVGNGRCRVYAETGRVLCELCAVRGGTGRPTSMWVEYNLSTGRACLTTMPSRWLHFGLWLAYNMQASARGCFALHASAVVCDGRAVLFLGESGTGKSTHAQLWCKSFNGCRLLNDDSPVVAAVDGGLRVYGSPWSGKTPCYLAESYPLHGIARLQQASWNLAQRLGSLASIAALVPSFPPMLAHVPVFRERMLQLVETCVLQVPVLRLDCRPDTAAARCCRQAMQ